VTALALVEDLVLPLSRQLRLEASRMSFSRPLPVFSRFVSFLSILTLFTVFSTRAQSASDPWATAQTVQPAELATELARRDSTLMVLFVGFQRLYTAGHIKGAHYHGSGGSAEGLVDIKKWARSLPRATHLVLYCGCCPMEKCPNLRPAFSALQEMGFTNLRVLILPSSFAVDWVEKGWPYEKGQ
jgi:thiosulfate/3-mercaptopyruvate sulfurtransferase